MPDTTASHPTSLCTLVCSCTEQGGVGTLSGDHRRGWKHYSDLWHQDSGISEHIQAFLHIPLRFPTAFFDPRHWPLITYTF